MKVSYVEGLANHNGPESCGVAREGGVEALTGGRTGRVLSREIHALLRKQQVLRDADAVGERLRNGFRRLRFVILILSGAWASSPQVGAGCGNAARPPVEGVMSDHDPYSDFLCLRSGRRRVPVS